MTKQIALEEDVHADLLLLKSIIRKNYPDSAKNLSTVLRYIFERAGYTEAFFDRMREEGVKE